MYSVMIDCNVYDSLADDQKVCDEIGRLFHAGVLEVLVTPTIRDELENSHFCTVPNFFPVTDITEASIALGYTKLGGMRFGDGKMYDDHRGNSNNIKDAMIAEAAQCDCNIFVSEDKRCRNRLKRLSKKCCCFSYAEFVAWLWSVTPHSP